MNAVFIQKAFTRLTGRAVPSWYTRPFFFGALLAFGLNCAPRTGSSPWPPPSPVLIPGQGGAVPPRTPGGGNFVPRNAGVLAYAAEDPARDADRPGPTDDRIRAFFLVLERAAKAAGTPAPISGTRYEAAAAELASAVDGEDGVADDLTRFIHSHCGIVDPEHTMLVVRASPRLEADQLAGFQGDLTTMLRTTPWRRVGVAIDHRPDGDVMVVALFHQYVVLTPLPRRLRGRTRLSGRLLEPHAGLQGIVVTPSGATRELRVGDRAGGTGPGFDALLACDAGAGRYQVELLGTAGRGPTVLANFPVYCDADPPATFSWKRSAPETFADAAAAEGAMLKALNQDRGRAAVRPVTLNEALSRVARAHSEDMAESGVVAHVSRRTGSAMNRVQKAGLRPSLLAENVGQAGSVADVQRGLMGSPGHRSNILNPDVTDVGIGITARRLGQGQSMTFFVTQVFAAGLE